MPFGQIRIQLKRTTTMELGLLQPRTRRIQIKMACRANKRKRGMRQGKGGISSDRMAEVLSRLVEHGWVTRGTKPVAPYEFCIRHGVLAISWAALRHGWTQRPVQCDSDSLRNLVLQVG